MSGGYFDYNQWKIGEIADEIEQLVRDNNDQSTNEWGDPVGRDYGLLTLAEFHRAIRILRMAEVYAQRIDWLVSGDDSEKSFHRRLAEDLEKIKESIIMNQSIVITGAKT